MIVKVLTDIAPQLAGDDPRRVRVEAMNAEIDRVTRVENAYLRFLGSWLAFERFLLSKVCNPNRGLPQWVVESAVELWSMLDRKRLSGRSRFLSWLLLRAQEACKKQQKTNEECNGTKERRVGSRRVSIWRYDFLRLPPLWTSESKPDLQTQSPIISGFGEPGSSERFGAARLIRPVKQRRCDIADDRTGLS